MTEAKLKEFETELRENLPEAVRVQLPEDQLAAALPKNADGKSEATHTVKAPSLDGLEGFSMPSMGG